VAWDSSVQGQRLEQQSQGSECRTPLKARAGADDGGSALMDWHESFVIDVDTDLDGLKPWT
jgi:hypothetical protein